MVDFWKWAYSDLTGNTERGCFAEYLVALACGIDDQVRSIWNSFDLEFNGIKIEVKSSAYLQTWKQKKLSKPVFGIQKTIAWDYKTSKYDNSKKRQADVYVFALLAHKEKSSVDPLHTKQWEFYILNTSIISRELGNAKQIALNRIKALKAIESDFNMLCENIKITYSMDHNQKII